MLNFDMVGRLDEAKGLAINGVGTAEEWDEIVEKANKAKLKVTTTESGIGPSDHTSFYLQDLPVLHFFTGAHEDYHKPSDDADKINYQGMQNVAELVCEVIKLTDDQPSLSFQKTKEEKKDTPRFTVTLGVMPDYLFDGEGLRIDGIIEDRPAQKAGLKKGDIVIQLGDHPVNGMQGYMQALSKFNKGDKTTVKVKRGEEEIEAELQF
jgi:C-terminal processing protease CtpA/Prc